MYDILIPAIFSLASVAVALAVACNARRHILDAARRKAEQIADAADARYLRLVALGAEERRGGIAYRRGAEAAVPALLAAGWRIPRAPASVEVVAAPEARLTPVSGQRTTIRCGPPAALAEWPDEPTEDAPEAVDEWGEVPSVPAASAVRCATILPPMPLPVLAPLERVTPQSPKEPRS